MLGAHEKTNEPVDSLVSYPFRKKAHNSCCLSKELQIFRHQVRFMIRHLTYQLWPLQLVLSHWLLDSLLYALVDRQMRGG